MPCNADFICRRRIPLIWYYWQFYLQKRDILSYNLLTQRVKFPEVILVTLTYTFNIGVIYLTYTFNIGVI